MTIVLPFAEVAREIRAIEILARPFLNPDDVYLFHTLSAQLINIQRTRSGGSFAIPEESPLRTIRCDGGYEADGRKGVYQGLRGELSCLWEIECVKTGRQKGPLAEFRVSGKASTKLRLVDDEEEAQMVLWRMEIGDSASPGTFFHTQLGEDDPGSALHMPLPVPRLPTVPTTPMLALEYLLAELFQSRWPKHLAANGDAVAGWRRIQLRRVLAFIEWQESILRDRAGSPITDMKGAQPDPGLLLQGPVMARPSR